MLLNKHKQTIRVFHLLRDDEPQRIVSAVLSHDEDKRQVPMSYLCISNGEQQMVVKQTSVVQRG